MPHPFWNNNNDNVGVESAGASQKQTFSFLKSKLPPGITSASSDGDEQVEALLGVDVKDSLKKKRSAPVSELSNDNSKRKRSCDEEEESGNESHGNGSSYVESVSSSDDSSLELMPNVIPQNQVVTGLQDVTDVLRGQASTNTLQNQMLHSLPPAKAKEEDRAPTSPSEDLTEKRRKEEETKQKAREYANYVPPAQVPKPVQKVQQNNLMGYPLVNYMPPRPYVPIAPNPMVQQIQKQQHQLYLQQNMMRHNITKPQLYDKMVSRNVQVGQSQAKPIHAPVKEPKSLPQTVQLPTQIETSPKPAKPELRLDEDKNTVSTTSLLRKYGIKLEPIPLGVAVLPPLNLQTYQELKVMLGFDSVQNDLNQDWSAVLHLVDHEVIINKEEKLKDPTVKVKRKKFLDLAMESAEENNDPSIRGFRGIMLLFSFVCHLPDTPKTAKRILAHSLVRPVKSVDERYDVIDTAIKRCAYDPQVLQEDGWKTTKALTPEGPSGRSYLIGDLVHWDKSDCLVIAYVYDDEGCGDLWKLLFLDDHVPFDLETDELQQARRNYERKLAKKKQDSGRSTRPARVTMSNFCVGGIQNGIILAESYHTAARKGVKWPARVLHSSEVKAMSAPSARRGSSKNWIPVMFIAPYWNAEVNTRGKNAPTTTSDPYSLGTLFELEMVEASPDSCKEYSYEKLNVRELYAVFQMSGLPKAAFNRFYDSHRIALALKKYAVDHHLPDDQNIGALASLTESHVMSVKTFLFPDGILHLPYNHIIDHLPQPSINTTLVEGEEETIEKLIDLEGILKVMEPPTVWDARAAPSLSNNISSPAPSKIKKSFLNPTPSPRSMKSVKEFDSISIENIATEALLSFLRGRDENDWMEQILLSKMKDILLQLHSSLKNLQKNGNDGEWKHQLKILLGRCILAKSQGEDTIASLNTISSNRKVHLKSDWRKACERLFKLLSMKMSSKGFGRGVTSILTDSRCNSHITGSGSFERAIRIPAAVKGAKNAGAGSIHLPLHLTVPDEYIKHAENNVLPKAHMSSYTRRMKSKISSIPVDSKGVPLTDDSDSNASGGDDTMGSRGSYLAAITGVAAAIKAADMVTRGECVNAFCITRPPGHHAGRDLRPMKAISNGFCIFNPVACAALHAVTPLADGGCGMKRVVVIDFDVHHGNGTQDILGSTYDSRFLYVSLHAGGAHLNGFGDSDDSDNEDILSHLGGRNKEAIFPGKCGDTSPHPGVLNIPLGKKVTGLAMGNAIMTQVKPAVEKFSPDLVIISAGFDAHKNDPLGLGGLSAEDFGTLTQVICSMADKSCSGRVISVLEGGYGVPCCARQNTFLPPGVPRIQSISSVLGSDLPNDMEDDMPDGLRQKLDRCHSEGFIECVREHVAALSKCSHPQDTIKVS